MPIQDTIHKWTEGSGARFLRLLLVFFGMLGLAVWYNAAAFKNLSTIEGMDAAQVGRNIAEGKGFTTDFIRPFSMYLVRKHQGDAALKEESHPDLANAPLYPLLLAGALRLMPFPHAIPAAKDFGVHVPDLWIAGFNQILFFLAVWLVFRLGRRLFDEPVAWVSAAVFGGAELFWRFTTSGLSTMLLIVLFLGLLDVLSRLDTQERDGRARGVGRLLMLTFAAGLLTGLAAMTRYSFGWLFVPVVLFITASPLPRRGLMVAVCIMGFALVVAPWIARNYQVSGTPFGAAGYAVLQETDLLPGFELERTLNPDFSLMEGSRLRQKLTMGLKEIIEKQLPRLGGSWVTAFFLVGLLVPFRNPMLRRMRFFVVGSLGTLIVVQALGRTGLAADSPELNSENLLAVLAPAVFMFGVGLFFMLLDQFGLAVQAVRPMIVGAFLLLACAPLLFSLLIPVRTPLVYPPYYPPSIQERAALLGEEELVMSDVPWAFAWYGGRPSVWLSLRHREEPGLKFKNDFEAVYRAGRPIRGLYISQRTMKSVETTVLMPWLRRGGANEPWDRYAPDWESFVLLGVYLYQEIPTGFPLKTAPFVLVPELFLMDSERNDRKAIKAE